MARWPDPQTSNCELVYPGLRGSEEAARRESLSDWMREKAVGSGRVHQFYGPRLVWGGAHGKVCQPSCQSKAGELPLPPAICSATSPPFSCLLDTQCTTCQPSSRTIPDRHSIPIPSPRVRDTTMSLTSSR